MNSALEEKRGNGRLFAALMGFYFSYFISYFIKLSPSIIMPVLQQRYNFSSGVTGFISSMYFLPYATMQLFVGPLCRKFGSGRLVGSGLVLAAIGLLTFANGSTVAVLALGRFLLGLGTSPIFIGMIYHLRDAFQEERYARYYGIGIFVSALGSIVAAAPLKALLNVVPMDDFFLLIALFTLALGFFMFIMDRSKMTKSAVRKRLLPSIAGDIKLTFTTPVLIAGVLLWLIQAPSLVCYQGLWCSRWTEAAFPSLARFSGYSGIAISIGTILSSTVGENWTQTYMKRTGRTLNRTLIRLCLFHITTTMLLSFVKQVDSLPMFCLSMFCDILFGFTTGSLIVQVGVLVKENTSAEDNASVMGVFNFTGCVSQQLSQWFTGLEVDLFVTGFGLNMAFCMTFTTQAVLFAVLTLVAFTLFRGRFSSRS